MSLKLIFSKISDPIYLTYELLLGNRKLILPTIVGLIIALTIISQNSILVESYRGEIFEELVFRPETALNGDISTIIKPDSHQHFPGFNFPDFFTDFDIFNGSLSNSLLQSDYSENIVERFWFSEQNIEIWVNRSTWNGSGFELRTRGISSYCSSSSEFYDQLEDILKEEGTGRLPENSSEFLLIRPKNEYGFIEEELENITLNTEINITLPVRWDSNGTMRNNRTVKIVGMLDFTPYWYMDIEKFLNGQGNRDNSENVSYLSRKYIGTSWRYGLLTYPSLLNQTLIDLSINSSEIEWRGDISGKIFLNHRGFDAFNINAEKLKLKKFLILFEDSIYSLQFEGYGSVSSQLLDGIQAFETTILGLLIILLLVSFPVICIALYLVIYSFGLIQRQKQEQIGIIKTRGGSSIQVFTVLIGEMIISTIIAVIIGFLLSIFLSEVVLRSTNYLEFIGDPIPVKFSIKMLGTLTIWALLIALLLNFSRILRMSRQKITETLIPVETQEPIWKRYYFDVITFTVGTATWLILMQLTRMSYSGEDTSGLTMIYTLMSFLGIPAPFFIFFGTIMVIARFFPILMRKLSELLWRIEGGIYAFAIRNIVRHKQAANRAVLLITLAMSFSILASSLIFSMDETQQIALYYDSGADISLNTRTSRNDTIIKLLKENVSDINHVSWMYSGDCYVPGTISRQYNFLFLDPSTYAQTAFFKSNFKISRALSNLMTQISDNESIILFDGNLKADVSDLKIGGNLSIRFSNETNNEIHSFKISGTFHLWPMMYPEPWYDFASAYWLIGSIGMFQSLNQSNYLDNFEGKYLAKLDSHTNVKHSIEKIYNLTGTIPNSPVLAYREYKDGFSRHFSLSILNTDLIVCITVSIIGVIMYAFFTYVERGKEIGVERALGMTRFQTALSFSVEASTILAFGTVIGFFTGTYFVTMFLQVTQFGDTIPPPIVSYPMPLLIQIILIILVVATIGTIAAAYTATRKDISRILKVE